MRRNRCEVIERVERFSEVAPAWDALAGAHPDPFSETAWLAPWWRAFAPHDGLALLACRDGAVVGGFALVRGGRELAGMCNEHTPRSRLLAADDEAREALVAEALRRGLGVHVRPIPDDDPLLHGRPDVPRTVREDLVSPYVDTTGDFDTWRRGSKSRWGAPLERFRRKMAREHGLRLVLNASPDDLERELAEGFAVEGSGWKRSEGTAIVSNPATERFYREVAQAFHGTGRLACSRLELDGRLAAWDLSLLHDGRVYLLKTGFDESFRRLAPGLVLRLSVIEDCFAHGIRAHELLGSGEEWKLKFATGAHRHHAVRLFRRSPAGLVRYGMRRGRQLGGAMLRARRAVG